MFNEEKMNAIMDYIRKFSEKNGYTPSVREIGQHCGIKSTATVHNYLGKLRARGFLSKEDNKKRAVSIGRSATVTIPLIGMVTAGQPIFAYENYEDYYAFPAGEFRGESLFMLRVKGTSMIDANIFDGDKIIVRRQQDAADGDIVVALTEDFATVKRIFYRDGKVVLHPENTTMSDMIFEPDEISVLGKVVGLIRNYTA